MCSWVNANDYVGDSVLTMQSNECAAPKLETVMKDAYETFSQAFNLNTGVYDGRSECQWIIVAVRLYKTLA